jgi:oxygen-independent coproporphyrinogen-3 oxidase
MDRLMRTYVDALGAELETARARLPFGELETVYLGGGTPSLLPPDLVRRLLRAVHSGFELAAGAEVTLEANPASTDYQRLLAWREEGVNRLSLGVQGFDRRALAVLERRTDGAQAVAAFRAAREHGFENISLDLIYGVPYQEPAAWLDTVERALALEPEHLSCYCLTLEPGTLLDRRRRAGRLPEVDADTQWSQLDAASDRLAAAGYRRYEVSSWSRPGFESWHNRAYWACRPVYGAGAGAHSYATDGAAAWRWWNRARPSDYIAAARDPASGGEALDARLARAEALMLGLRTADGLEPPAGFEAELEGLLAQGLIERRRGRVAPTRRGLDLHNQVALAVL